MQSSYDNTVMDCFRRLGLPIAALPYPRDQIKHFPTMSNAVSEILRDRVGVHARTHARTHRSRTAVWRDIEIPPAT